MFVWNCNTKYIYAQGSSATATCSTYQWYEIEIEVTGTAVVFKDDGGCSDISKYDALGASPVYVNVGADCDWSCDEGEGAQWDWIHINPVNDWEQVGGDNTRCNEGSGCPSGNAVDLAACTAMADAAGHNFIEYDAGRQCCNTHATCTTRTGTSNPWKLYTKAAASEYPATCIGYSPSDWGDNTNYCCTDTTGDGCNEAVSTCPTDTTMADPTNCATWCRAAYSGSNEYFHFANYGTWTECACGSRTAGAENTACSSNTQEHGWCYYELTSC